MSDVTGNRQGIDALYSQERTPLYPEALEVFMQDFDRQEFLGKLVTDPGYWGQRIEYVQEKLRDAEVARKGVESIASDAATFIEREPEEFAKLPSEQRAILTELAARVSED